MVRDLDMDKALKSAPPDVAGSIRAAVASGQIPFQKIPSYKRGGIVRKTGLAKVHKGERILRASRILGGAKNRTARRLPVKNRKAARKYA